MYNASGDKTRRVQDLAENGAIWSDNGVAPWNELEING